VGASGASAISASAAGVYAENRIYASLETTIDGDAASSRTITADSIRVGSHSTSSINAVAGAASLAASFSGGTSVAVSIGLSLAFNSIDTDVLAQADAARLTTRTGVLDISSSSRGSQLGSFTLAEAGQRSITPAKIDALANAGKNRYAKRTAVFSSTRGRSLALSTCER
jgi:hypothetical protein